MGRFNSGAGEASRLGNVCVIRSSVARRLLRYI